MPFLSSKNVVFNGKFRKVFGISRECSDYQMIFNTCFYGSEIGIWKLFGLPRCSDYQSSDYWEITVFKVTHLVEFKVKMVYASTEHKSEHKSVI